MKPMFAIACMSASLLAAPLFATTALAQVEVAGPNPGAPTAYAGATKEGFYDIDGRIQRVEEQIKSGRLGAGAMAEIRSIRSYEATQKARHNGELLDYDREVISLRLDKLVGRYHL